MRIDAGRATRLQTPALRPRALRTPSAYSGRFVFHDECDLSRVSAVTVIPKLYWAPTHYSPGENSLIACASRRPRSVLACAAIRREVRNESRAESRYFTRLAPVFRGQPETLARA